MLAKIGDPVLFVKYYLTTTCRTYGFSYTSAW